MRTRPRYGSPPPPSPVTAHPTICKVSQVLDLTDGLLLLLLLLLLSSSSFFGTLLQYIVHYWKSQNTGNLDIVNFFNIVNLSLMMNSSLDRNGGKWTYCIRRYSELFYAIHIPKFYCMRLFFVSNAPSYFFLPHSRPPPHTHKCFDFANKIENNIRVPVLEEGGEERRREVGRRLSRFFACPPSVPLLGFANFGHGCGWRGRKKTRTPRPQQNNFLPLTRQEIGIQQCVLLLWNLFLYAQ